jgi:hypothetical protein
MRWVFFTKIRGADGTRTPSFKQVFSRFLAEYFNRLRQNWVSPGKKSASGIVALNPPKEDGGVFCHLAVAAPSARINQSVFGLGYFVVFNVIIIH